MWQVRQVAPIVSSVMGGLVLHASSLLVEGSVVAFVGASGVGKSSTAWEGVRAGHELVSDDLLPIDSSTQPPRPSAAAAPTPRHRVFPRAWPRPRCQSSAWPSRTPSARWWRTGSVSTSTHRPGRSSSMRTTASPPRRPPYACPLRRARAPRRCARSPHRRPHPRLMGGFAAFVSWDGHNDAAALDAAMAAIPHRSTAGSAHDDGRCRNAAGRDAPKPNDGWRIATLGPLTLVGDVRVWDTGSLRSVAGSDATDVRAPHPRRIRAARSPHARRR